MENAGQPVHVVAEDVLYYQPMVRHRRAVCRVMSLPLSMMMARLLNNKWHGSTTHYYDHHDIKEKSFCRTIGSNCVFHNKIQ
jgi:hypothetical protein